MGADLRAATRPDKEIAAQERCSHVEAAFSKERSDSHRTLPLDLPAWPSLAHDFISMLSRHRFAFCSDDDHQEVRDNRHRRDRQVLVHNLAEKGRSESYHFAIN